MATVTAKRPNRVMCFGIVGFLRFFGFVMSILYNEVIP
jgi:hypothetical protein